MEPFTPKDTAQDPVRPTLGNVAPAPLKNVFGSVTPTHCPACLGCGTSYSSCLEHLFLQAQHGCHFLQETLLDPHLGQVPLWAVTPIPPGFSHHSPAHSGPHCPGSGLCPSLDSRPVGAGLRLSLSPLGPQHCPPQGHVVLHTYGITKATWFSQTFGVPSPLDQQDPTPSYPKHTL